MHRSNNLFFFGYCSRARIQHAARSLSRYTITSFRKCPPTRPPHRTCNIPCARWCESYTRVARVCECVGHCRAPARPYHSGVHVLCTYELDLKATCPTRCSSCIRKTRTQLHICTQTSMEQHTRTHPNIQPPPPTPVNLCRTLFGVHVHQNNACALSVEMWKCVRACVWSAACVCSCRVVCISLSALLLLPLFIASVMGGNMSRI